MRCPPMPCPLFRPASALARAAAVLVAAAVLDVAPVHGQDFDAGKSAPSLFAANCSACHRTPRGLGKRMNRFSLYSYMREHYTSSQATAAELTAYLLAVGGEAPRAKPKPAPPRQAATAAASAASRSPAPPAARASSASSRRGNRIPDPIATPRPPGDVPNH